MKLIYVAGAYTSNPSKNMEIAEKASIELIRNGFAVFTPHKNFYDYQKYEDVHYETYLRMDFEIIRRCDAVYVLDNWIYSPGTKREIDICEEWGIPVFWQHQLNECDFVPEMVHSIEHNKTLQKAITHYGEPVQVLKAIEECAELIDALYCHIDSTDKTSEFDILNMHQSATHIRHIVKRLMEDKSVYIDNPENHNGVVTEIADVRIMLQQLEMFLVSPEEVHDQIDFKVKRLEKRIKVIQNDI